MSVCADGVWGRTQSNGDQSVFLPNRKPKPAIRAQRALLGALSIAHRIHTCVACFPLAYISKTKCLLYIVTGLPDSNYAFEAMQNQHAKGNNSTCFTLRETRDIAQKRLYSIELIQPELCMPYLPQVILGVCCAGLCVRLTSQKSFNLLPFVR